jgi:hypothetical protein
VRAVPDELVELDEASLVAQLLDALAGGLLSRSVLLIDRGLSAGGDGLVVAVLEVGDPAGGRAQVRGGICGHA